MKNYPVKPCNQYLKFLKIYFIILSAFFVPIAVVNAGSDLSGVNSEIESALLKKDWAQLSQLLKEVTPESSQPVLRYLKGHALLATNRNNESVSLFYQMTGDDLKQYVDWSSALTKKYPDSASVQYIVGDAQSRVGNFTEAHTFLTRAVELDSKNYLALNARGVVATLQGKHSEAMQDFSKVIELAPQLLDAYNNIGMLRIHQAQGRVGAKKRFQSVVNKHKDFALAYHGLGCVELLKSNNSIAADNANIQYAHKLLPELQDLLLVNEYRYADSVLQKKTATMVAGAEGTTINRSYSQSASSLNHAVNEVEKAQIAVQNSNIFTRGGNVKRLQHAQGNVVSIANNMPSEHRDRILSENPALAGSARQSISAHKTRVGKLEQQANSGANTLRKVSYIASAVDVMGGMGALAFKSPSPSITVSTAARVSGGGTAAVSTVTKIGGNAAKAKAPLNAVSTMVSLGAKAVRLSSNINRHGYEQSRAQAQSAGKQLSNLESQWTVKTPSHSASSSMRTPSVSAPDRSINMGTHGNIGGGKPPGGPGYNGATTDKFQVTWDDNDWPFVPIFGLLYLNVQVDTQQDEG